MKKQFFVPFIILSLFFTACDDSKTGDLKDIPPVSTKNRGTGVKEYNIEGVTEAGYKYIHHVKNNTVLPEVGDQVKYHKIVYKNDTTVLQSTYYLLEPRADILVEPDSAPQPPHPTFHALFLMSPGDSLTVYQPLDTFPKERLPNGITNKDVFTYNLKVLDIKPKNVIEKEIADTKARHKSVGDSLAVFIKDFKAGKLDNQIMKSDSSGLRYVIHKQGTGDKVKDGGFVKVHYLGMLEDGTVFDGSFANAKPFPTRIGRGKVIAGWDEAIPLLNEGGEATLIVPWQLAYGVAGRPPAIPQRADLYFFVSLVNVY